MGGLNLRFVVLIVGFFIEGLGGVLGFLFFCFNIWFLNIGLFLMDVCFFIKVVMFFSWGDFLFLIIL